MPPIALAAPFWFKVMTSPDIILDYARKERIGLEEAVFAEGKSTAQLIEILMLLVQKGERALFTRLTPTWFAELPEYWQEQIDYDPVSQTGILGSLREAGGTPQIAVVSAGTSDTRVALEVVRTLRYSGYECTRVFDVGVAGLWRILDRLPLLVDMAVVVVVAGMDAALPSVIGGLVGGLVIAVPTSTGYGVASGGATALHAALASCSPGITVVNIDNGYGAACAAIRVINRRIGYQENR